MGTTHGCPDDCGGADCSGPGIRGGAAAGASVRRRDGERVDDPEVLARIARARDPARLGGCLDLPYPNGHIQATGVTPPDASSTATTTLARAPRRAEVRRVVRVREGAAAAAATCRRATWATARSSPRAALACAVRLLDRGFFRIGSEGYAEENETYGLATMRKRHVTLEDGGLMSSTTPPRAGSATCRRADDARARSSSGSSGGAEAATSCSPTRRAAAGGTCVGGHQRVLKEATGGDYSAKDFRTWNATVLAAVALAVSGEAASTKTAASGRSDAPSKRWPSTSATPPRSAAPPTSTRACSTATTAADDRAGARARGGEAASRRAADPPAGAGAGGTRPNRRPLGRRPVWRASPPSQHGRRRGWPSRVRICRGLTFAVLRAASARAAYDSGGPARA